MDPIVTKICCHTQHKVDKTRFEWAIDNFSLMEATVESDEFSLKTNNQYKFSLYFDNKYSDDAYVQLKLFQRGSDTSHDFVLKVKLSIPTAMSTEVDTSEIVFNLQSNSKIYNLIRWSTLSENADRLLPHDKLTIVCEMSLSSNVCNTSVSQFKVPECKLLENFGNLLDSENFSDVTLVVGDRNIQTHKAILSARSPVFAAMFKHKMVELEQNRVTINDIDYDVLMEILRFIYTGKTLNLENMAHGLLVAAEKYAIETLKVMCEESLYNALTIENAAVTLILADRHHADQLKAQVIKFIIVNLKAVFQTVRWEDMIKECPQLFAEIAGKM